MQKELQGSPLIRLTEYVGLTEYKKTTFVQKDGYRSSVKYGIM